MKAPGFAAELPNGIEIVDHRVNPASPVAIACLITLADVPAGMPFGLQDVDKLLANAVGALVKAGAAVICVEDMEGDHGEPCVVGHATADAIKNTRTRLVGVDSLAEAAEMKAIRDESLTRRVGHLAALDEICSCLQQAAEAHPVGPFREFLGLALQQDNDQFDVCRAAEALLSLEKDLGAPLPPDAKRVLLACSYESRLDREAVGPELNELALRIKNHKKTGVLSPILTERFQFESSDPVHRAIRRVRVQTDDGIIMLTPPELTALRKCNEFIQFIDSRAGEPETLGEVLLTGEHNARVARSGFSNQSDAAESWCRYLTSLFNTAEVLGIDLSAYSQLSLFYEKNALLQAIASEQFAESLLAGIEKAWLYCETRVCGSNQERNLVTCIRHVLLLRSLALLEITQERYEELTELWDECRLSHVVKVVRGAGVAVSGEVVEAAAEFDSRRERLLQFYKLAHSRARQMANRTVELAKAHGGKAVLICLGFHQSSVKAVWLAQGVSYFFGWPAPTREMLQ